MSQPSNEKTRLLQPMSSRYTFDHNLLNERRRRLKHFQCCLCSSFLVVFTTAIIILVSYSIHIQSNTSNITEPVSNVDFDNETTLPSDIFVKLFEVRSMPIEDRVEPATFKLSQELEPAMLEGQKLLIEKDKVDNQNKPLERGSPSYKHQTVMATSQKARLISRKGYEEEGATRFFYGNQNNLNYISKICYTNVTEPLLVDICFQTIKCNYLHKYRSYNGTCNNLNHPNTFGVAYRAFRRALPPHYADGISKPRASQSGKDLPTARTVSVKVHRSYYKDDSKFSVMLAVWGQFLDHDITATALSRKQNGESISCCQENTTLPSECFPVYLDENDSFRELNVSCIEFVRSAPAPTCCLGPRQQMNQVSAFIDGSVVYGTDQDTVLSLRTMQNGLLKMFISKENKTLLPLSNNEEDGCNSETEVQKGRYCFLSGDARANENVHLTSMHVIWARQHNLLAKKLHGLNPHWNDETVFQEARRILSAQMQHITYNEFLPILLGKAVMEKYELLPKQEGYFYKYNPTIDPSIANVFATSAFRFAHSLIPSLIKTLANKTGTPEYIQMHKMLFNPYQLYDEGGLNTALNSAVDTNIEAYDPYFSNEVKSHLFEDPNKNNKSKTCGLDLVSLNIQRGRDHGLQGYIFWKEHCGLNKTKTFDDLQEIMEQSALDSIKAVYKVVEDIDLYTGALSEKPIKNTVLGPTFTCLILDQFYRIKFGDRFWYESHEKPHGFTINQLNEIRKTTLAGIICDNGDELPSIVPFVMKKSDQNNQKISCEKIPKSNLEFWKENVYFINLSKQILSSNIARP